MAVRVGRRQDARRRLRPRGVSGRSAHTAVAAAAVQGDVQADEALRRVGPRGVAQCTDGYLAHGMAQGEFRPEQRRGRASRQAAERAHRRRSTRQGQAQGQERVAHRVPPRTLDAGSPAAADHRPLRTRGRRKAGARRSTLRRVSGALWIRSGDHDAAAARARGGRYALSLRPDAQRARARRGGGTREGWEDLYRRGLASEERV
mmetsp:Transcript_7768/g.34248  ORF Transcript_7768/g.34248 Transcript_7768/m.34248 type:complete len:204 (-) Transcript_7768:4432-5043(-)